MHVDHLDRRHRCPAPPASCPAPLRRDPAVHDPGVALPRRLAAGHPAGRDCGEPSRISIRKLGITSFRSGFADQGMTSRARAYCGGTRYRLSAGMLSSKRGPELLHRPDRILPLRSGRRYFLEKSSTPTSDGLDTVVSIVECSRSLITSWRRCRCQFCGYRLFGVVCRWWTTECIDQIAGPLLTRRAVLPNPRHEIRSNMRHEIRSMRNTACDDH